MDTTQIMEKMVAFSGGDLHDITHFMTVWTFAKKIGEQEGLDAHTLFILEVAAIVHDIACPLCRQKYGRADGRLQETESEPLVRSFLADTGLSADDIDRVAFLASHHHTLEGIEGMDWQILVEADFIANAMENRTSREDMLDFCEKVMRTDAARQIMEENFGL